MFQQYLLYQHERTLALVFPALNARRRFLIHHTVQEDFPNLATFSVGEDESRRTVVTTPEVLREQERSKEQEQEQPKQKAQRQQTRSPAYGRNTKGDNSQNFKSQGLPNGKVGEGRGQVQQASKDPTELDATGGRDSPSSGTSRRRKRARRRKSSRDSRSRSKDSANPQTHNRIDPKPVIANSQDSQSIEISDNKGGVEIGRGEKKCVNKTSIIYSKSENIQNNQSDNSNTKPVQYQSRNNSVSNNPNSSVYNSVQSNGVHVLKSGRCVSESDTVDIPPYRSSSKGESAITRITGGGEGEEKARAHSGGRWPEEGVNLSQTRIKGRQQPWKQYSLDNSVNVRNNSYHDTQRWCGGPSGVYAASPSRGSSNHSNNASPVRMIATQHQPEINLANHRRRGKAAAQIYRPPPARCNGTEIMGPQPESHIPNHHDASGGVTSQNRQRSKRPDQQLYRPGATTRRPAQQLYVPRSKRMPDSPSARVTPTPGEHDHPPRPPSPAYSVSSIVSEFSGRNRYGQESRQGSQVSLHEDEDIYGKSPNQKEDFSRESTPGQCKQNNRFSNQTMQLLERCINRDANTPNSQNNKWESDSINNSPSKSNKNSRSRKGRRGVNNEDLIEKSPTPTRDVHSKENLMHPVEQNSQPRKGRRNRARNSRSREGSMDKVFNGDEGNKVGSNGNGDRGFGSCERVFYNTTLINQPNQERHDRGYDNYDRYTSSRNSSVASSRNNSRERTPKSVSPHYGSSPQYGVPHFASPQQSYSNGNWREKGSSNPNSPQKSPLSRQNSCNKPPSGRLGSLPNVALNFNDNRKSLEVCSDNWRSLDSSTDTRRSLENSAEENHKYPNSLSPLQQGSPLCRLSQDNGESKPLVNSHTAIASVIDAAHRLQEIAIKESQTTTTATSYSPRSHSSPINTPNYSPKHSPKSSRHQSPTHSCINSNSHSPLHSPTSTSTSFSYTNTLIDTKSDITTSAHSSNSSHSYSNEESVADSSNSLAYNSIQLHSTNYLDETLVNGEVSSTETTVENVPEVSMDINGSSGSIKDDAKTSSEQTKSDHVKDAKKNPKKFSFNWADEVEDSWDTLFDDSGECVDPNVISQLNDSVGNIKLEKPKNDYYSFHPKDSSPVHMNDDEYTHVIEIFDFPVSFKTQDLMSIFSVYNNTGFDIKWVDDTHALGVFATALVASEALSLDHPFLKTRPLSLATAASKTKALRITEALLPYKARPTTCANLARRLVSQSLGIRVNIPKDVREAERQKLKDAKARKKMVAKQRVDAWEGTLA